MTRGPTANVLTPERLSKLRAFAAGEQPELPPIQRKWFVSHGYLAPSAGKRPARLTSGRRRIAPRPHELTAKGRDAVAADAPDETAAAQPDLGLTLAATIALLQLSRGTGRLIQPMIRRALSRRGWIATRLAPASTAIETYVTDAGLFALADSPHVGQAQREVDRAVPQLVATGYRSDSVKRSVRK